MGRPNLRRLTWRKGRAETGRYHGIYVPVNSRAKGKRGELEAVKLLRRLGFPHARRTQQFNGDGVGDVVFGDELTDHRLHLEVKFGCRGMALGTELLRKAIHQAEHDSDGKLWVVLWRPPRTSVWLATALLQNVPMTAYGDEGVLRLIDWLRFGDDMQGL